MAGGMLLGVLKVANIFQGTVVRSMVAVFGSMVVVRFDKDKHMGETHLYKVYMCRSSLTYLRYHRHCKRTTDVLT